MGVWEVTIELEYNECLFYMYKDVCANDIYSAVSEITYYLDEGIIECPDGCKSAIVAVELVG